MSWDEGLLDGRSDEQRDQVLACADLVGRSGARQFELGHTGVPAAGTWYANAFYRGKRLWVDRQAGPAEAAMALAERLLTGAKCRCGRLVALRDGGAVAFVSSTLPDGTPWTAEMAARAGTCRWRLVGDRWEPSCPIPAQHRRGPL